jgi:hypothetical protein
MSSEHPRRSPRPLRPVERFLGASEASGGPFALLGVSPLACSDELVLSALDRQVERIAHHPQCDTPEADEVRLALHAAAAQLLDPAVRTHLIARWTNRGTADVGPSGPSAAAEAAPALSPAPHRPSAHKLLEHDAILTLGLFGGWNQRSLRRLLSIAHARGFSNAQVATTLRSLASTRRPAAQTDPGASPRFASPPLTATSAAAPSPVQQTVRQPAAPPASRHPASQSTQAPAVSKSAPESPPVQDDAYLEQTDPLPGLLLRAGIFTLVAAVALAIMAGLVLLITAQTRPPTTIAQSKPDPAIVEPAVEEPQEPAEPEPQIAKAPAVRRPDIRTLAQEIAASTEAIDLNPAEAGARLSLAVDVLAANWHKLPGDRLIACHDGLVEFLYRASGRQELTRTALEAIARGSTVLTQGRALTPDEVLPAVWSPGMLSRLMREKDLPLPARLAIESDLASFFGAAAPPTERSFEAGALAALLKLPQRLIHTPVVEAAAAEAPSEQPAQHIVAEAWDRWVAAVDAFSAGDAALRSRLLISGLETVLIRGPEPNENRAAGEVITDLVVRIPWREGDDSRRWLLRAFSDRLITNADLHAVTSALATRSGAEGIDLTMVLSTSAADRVRADLRERYASVWSIGDTISREETTLAWVQQARVLLDEQFSASTEAEVLARAALLARLNEAAHWQWRGQQEHASAIIRDLPLFTDQALRLPTSTPHEGSIMRNSAWAEQYLAARQSIRARRDLLENLNAMQGWLGDVDAAVLVQEAVSGSPPEIRQQALATVRRFARSPAVIKALLDRLPKVPRLQSNSQMVEAVAGKHLPRIREEAWPVEARRALVERLMEELSARGPMARVDRAADLLARSYDAMNRVVPASGAVTPGHATAQLQSTASQLWSSWRSAAEPLVPSVSPPLALSHIDRRRAGRLVHAQGPVQTFAAEQVSICELMAYIVTCERPGRIEDIRAALGEMADSRRSAAHIFDQLVAVERAVVRLWLIRMVEEEPI